MSARCFFVIRVDLLHVAAEHGACLSDAAQSVQVEHSDGLHALLIGINS